VRDRLGTADVFIVVGGGGVGQVVVEGGGVWCCWCEGSFLELDILKEFI